MGHYGVTIGKRSKNVQKWIPWTGLICKTPEMSFSFASGLRTRSAGDIVERLRHHSQISSEVNQLSEISLIAIGDITVP